MAYTVEKRIRQVPQVGVAPYRQIHAHSTGNPRSTVQNEADYYHNKDPYLGTFSHLVGNGRVIQVSEVGRGAWDVGGGWNTETYASVELIESHSSQAEFLKDYKIYCELLHDLAKQGGIPLTVDDGNLAGIKTHNYCTYNQPNNSSDHVDPIPYLAKWGINLAKFRSDVINAKSGSVNIPAPNQTKKTKEGNVMLLFKENGKIYWLVGNEYTYVKNPNDLKQIRTMMSKAGYDTWEHTNSTQISYIKKIATEKK